ncbi:MAG TPA: ABC-F family ATP-binding cassette domain-containing protein [bacterium]|nr:ABC-F family ATP-binding cassette domain-containing protein [bacterium]
MPLVSAVNLTKSYAGVPVLAGASCALEPGQKVGLVGRNGAGKTTLLRTIGGLETSDGGQVVFAPGATAGYLPQLPVVEESRTLWEEAASAFATARGAERRLREAEARLALPEVHGDDAVLAAALDEYGRLRDLFERAGGFTYEADIRRTLAGLGFREEQWTRPLASMSGGQRARAALARLLLTGPDLLLLDEPTNHLDLDALEWLQAFLQNFRGAVLVVSHDRYLLDAVTARTFELDAGRIEEYPGGYTTYVAEREARRARQQELFERQREEIAGLEEYIRRNRAGQKSRQAKSREKRLEKIVRVEAPRIVRGPAFRLDAPRRGPQVVVRLRGLGKRYGETAVLSDVSLEVRRAEKIGVIGPNGAGKTTLLRIVAGLEPPSAGIAELGPGVRVGYFAQHAEETLDLSLTVLDAVLGDRAMSPEQVRRVLGRFLFSGETVYKRVGDLSGGEQRRVALARLVLDRPDLLLLDEPTTHFDLPSLEALEQALGTFEGAILLASHDRYLLDHVARRLLIVDAGSVRGVAGPYHAYREALTTGAATAGSTPAAASAGSANSRPASWPDRARRAEPDRDGPEGRRSRSGGAGRGSGRGASADVVDVHAMLEQIGSLEEEQKHLSRLMGDPELYRDAARARETVRRYEEVNTELESLYARLTAAEEGAGG